MTLLPHASAETPVQPTVVRPALVLPDHVVTQAEVVAALAEHFAGVPHLQQGLDLMRNTTVRTRHLLVPLHEMLSPATFGERNARYAKEVVRLGASAATAALDNAGIRAADVDCMVFVSCTGYMLPGPDAYIAQEIGCRPTMRRIPIQQMGCAAGVGGLAEAFHYIRAYPQAQVLVVAVEFPSLSFQVSRASLSDFISAAIFSDAGAAAVVRARPGDCGFQITDAVQHLLGDSTDVIYGDTTEVGFHFETNPKVRSTVQYVIPTLVDLVRRQGWSEADLSFCISHTGGPAVMTGVEDGLGLPPGTLAPSRRSLTEIGNPSSVSVFDVLLRHHERPPAPASRGMMVAFGPGFTTEALAGIWRGPDDTTPEAQSAVAVPAPGPRLVRVRGEVIGTPAVNSAPLTRREFQVAELVALGLTNGQISHRLRIAHWTAVNHVRNVMRKLECCSRVQVARWYLDVTGGVHDTGWQVPQVAPALQLART
jgi:1,3,6,8-tetrahydroxynaphthalene synthase